MWGDQLVAFFPGEDVFIGRLAGKRQRQHPPEGLRQRHLPFLVALPYYAEAPGDAIDYPNIGNPKAQHLADTQARFSESARTAVRSAGES